VASEVVLLSTFHFLRDIPLRPYQPLKDGDENQNAKDGKQQSDICGK
jgi:hypothetical protein